MLVVLVIHLICAAGATVSFWAAAVAPKGERLHRAAGRWFARFVYATAVTGAAMALARLMLPGLIDPAGVPPELLAQTVAAERQTMWLVLYVLLIIVAPVQHGVAVVAAGPRPPAVRSRTHAVLTLSAFAGSFAIIPAALLWQQWLFLIVAPIGLVVGLRQLKYATQRTATRREWEREHLTSMLTAGVTLHTALFVFGATRTLALVLRGPWTLAPWVVPACIGLPLILWLRRARRQTAASE